MKVQIVSLKGKSNYKLNCEITNSKIESPLSFDAFDLNVVDMQDEDIWKNDDNSQSSLNIIKELKDIGEIIRNTQKSTNIVLFPQNVKFKYHKALSGGYYREEEIKNMLYNMIHNFFSKILNHDDYKIIYERTETKCDNKILKADFWININPPKNIILSSNVSEKPTVVKIKNRLYLTTLDIKLNENNLYHLLKQIGVLRDAIEIPDWLEKYEFYNDNILNDKINKNSQKIEDLKLEIAAAESEKNKNLKYKKILIESGASLVDIVFDMLQEMLDCNLSSFIDEKKEDFLINKETITFVGEVKGVTSNVRSEHISQTERHIQSYLDKLQDENILENVKGVLIINHSRNQSLSDRIAVHENQISLANKYGLLVITSDVMLKLYEKFKQEEIKQETIINLLKDKTGVLNITDF